MKIIMLLMAIAYIQLETYSIYSQNDLIIQGEVNVCSGKEYTYKVYSKCDCQDVKNDDIIWYIEGGIKRLDSKTDSIIVEWNSTTNNKKLLVGLEGVPFSTCDCIDINAELNVSLKPKLNINILTNDQTRICQNDSLKLSTSITNNPEKLVPYYQYAVGSSSTLYPIENHSGEEICITHDDISSEHWDKNLYFSSYVYRCETNKTQSTTSIPVRFLSSGTIESINYTSVLPSCKGKSDGKIIINSVSVNGEVYDQNNPYEDTIQISRRSENNEIVTTFPKTLTGFKAGTDTLKFLLTDGQCIFPHDVVVDTTPEIDININPQIISNINHKDYHVTCKNGSDGAIEVNTTNVVFPFSTTIKNETDETVFNHTFHANNISIQGLQAGKFSLIITDNNNCKGKNSFTLNEPSQSLGFDLDITDVLCYGDTSGSVKVVVDNSIPEVYGYKTSIRKSEQSDSLLSNMTSTSHLFEDLTSGIYGITVVDSLGCKAYQTDTINEPVPLSANINKTNPVCADGKGSISIIPDGGSGSYQFQLNDTGDYSSDATYALSPGTYSINVKDDNECRYDTVETIEEPANPLYFDNVISSASCYKISDGSIDLTAYYGFGEYVFTEQSNMEMKTGETVSFTGLKQNQAYSIKLKDDSCTVYDTITIPPNPDSLNVLSANTVNPSCADFQNGKISIHLENGYPNYQTIISAGEYEDTITFNSEMYEISGLESDAYILSIQDSKGCGDSISIDLLDPAPLEVSWNVTNISCFGFNDGSINAEITGGNSNYSYQWKNEFGQVISDTQVAGSLLGGNYELNVQDELGCNQIFTYALPDGPKLIVSDYKILPASCNTANDAIIEVKIVDVFDNYYYKLLDIDKNHVVTETNGNSTFYYEGLSYGEYALYVSTGSCDTLINFNITFGKLNLRIDSLKSASCYQANDGYLMLRSFNEQRPTTNTHYYWKNHSTGDEYNGIINDFSDLKPGNYEVIASNSNTTCVSDTLQFEIRQPNQLELNSTIIDTAKCAFGEGSIDIFIEGGISPYEIIAIQNENGFELTKQLDQIKPGDFYASVTDSNSCSRTDTFFMPVASVFPLSVEKIRDFTCPAYPAFIKVHTAENGKYSYVENSISKGFVKNGDSIEINSNGVHNFSFINSDGCKYDTSLLVKTINQIEVTDSIVNPTCNLSNGEIHLKIKNTEKNNFSFSWNHTVVDTNIMKDLPSGIYEVSVRDTFGCESNVTIPLSNSNGPVYDTITTKPTYCNINVGEITAQVVGGHPPFQYHWYDSKMEKMPFQTDIVQNLYSGMYFLKTVDARNCETIASIIIREDNTAMPQFSSFLVDSSNCDTPSGSAEVQVDQPSMEITWDSGSTDFLSSNFVGNDHASFTLVDSNGCSVKDSIFIPEKQSPVLLLQNIIHEYCNLADGTIHVTSRSGQEPYVYNWNFPSFGSTPVAQSLSAGEYWVYSIDNNGCKSDTGHVIINNLPSFSSEITEIHMPSCAGFSNGKASLTSKNAFEPLTFHWNDKQETGLNEYKGLTGGKNYVVITDSRGCSDSLSFFIPEPEKLYIKKQSLISPTCYNGSNGSIEIWPGGGQVPYKYRWSNGSHERKNKNLSSDEYFVIIDDENGCSDTADYFLDNPDSLTIFGINPAYTLCEGQEIILSPHNEWDTYSWKKDGLELSTLRNFNLVDSGNYQLLVTDNNDCEAQFGFGASVRNDLIDAEFLMSSNAIISDTITLIDVTWPEADGITWNLPNEVHVIEEGLHHCTIIPLEKGIFNVEMTATKASCIDSEKKILTIFDNENKMEEGNLPVENDLLKEFIVHPNPNDGVFTLSIKFQIETEFIMEILNLSTTTSYIKDSYSGSDTYEIELSRPDLPQGVYAIKIITSNNIYSFLTVKI